MQWTITDSCSLHENGDKISSDDKSESGDINRTAIVYTLRFSCLYANEYGSEPMILTFSPIF